MPASGKGKQKQTKKATAAATSEAESSFPSEFGVTVTHVMRSVHSYQWPEGPREIPHGMLVPSKYQYRLVDPIAMNGLCREIREKGLLLQNSLTVCFDCDQKEVKKAIQQAKANKLQGECNDGHHRMAALQVLIDEGNVTCQRTQELFTSNTMLPIVPYLNMPVRLKV